MSVDGELKFCPYGNEKWTFYYDEKNRNEIVSQFIVLLWLPAGTGGCDLKDIEDILRGNCFYYCVNGGSIEDIISKERALLSHIDKTAKRETCGIITLLYGDITVSAGYEVCEVAKECLIPEKECDRYGQSIYDERNDILLSLFIHFG